MGADELRSTRRRDVIVALDGDDAIRVDANDVVCAGRGADIVLGSQRGDRIHTGPGDDFVNAFGGSDVVFGGRGDDLLVGNGGLDSLAGDRGNDDVEGWADPDRIRGGPGSDRLWGGGDDEFLDESDDLLRGGPGRDAAAWATGRVRVDMNLGVALGEGRDVLHGIELAENHASTPDAVVTLGRYGWRRLTGRR